MSSVRLAMARRWRLTRGATGRAVSMARLRRVDHGTIPDHDSEVRLFAKVRNEATRLPYFLEYYFGLGVDRIFLVDNASDDETVARAVTSGPVHVFRTSEKFSKYPIWLDILLHRYGMGRWCVAADADELLVLPPPANDVHDMVRRLEHRGFTALRCLLLDMYPCGPVGMAPVYHAGMDPLECCRCFDREFTVEAVDILNRKRLTRFQTTRYSGGMRRRLFDLDMNLTKVGLFKMQRGTWLGEGAHHIDGAEVADGRGVMLHFKYLPGLVERIAADAFRGGHAAGGAYLAPIAQRLRDGELDRFDFHGTQTFESRQQLVSLGLLASLSDPHGSR